MKHFSVMMILLGTQGNYIASYEYDCCRVYIDTKFMTMLNSQK